MISLVIGSVDLVHVKGLDPAFSCLAARVDLVSVLGSRVYVQGLARLVRELVARVLGRYLRLLGIESRSSRRRTFSSLVVHLGTTALTVGIRAFPGHRCSHLDS
jgi:hypothetical protein